MTIIYSVGRSGRITKIERDIPEDAYIAQMKRNNKKLICKESLRNSPTKYALWFDSSKEWPAIIGVGVNK